MMKFFTLLGIVLCIDRFYLLTSCPVGCECEFYSEVSCYPHYGTDVFEKIPTSIPGNTTILYIRYQNITQIRKGDLSELQSLQILSIVDSNVQVIEDDAFENQSSLSVLYLYDNMIAEVSARTFAGLDKLRVLSVSDNAGMIMLPCSLSGLNSLTSLDIENTNVTFSTELFAGDRCTQRSIISSPFVKLEMLTTSAKLIDLTGEELASLQRLNYLRLYNPPSTFLTKFNISSLVSLSDLYLIGLTFFPLRFLHHENLTMIYISSSSFTHLPAYSFVNIPTVDKCIIQTSGLIYVHRDAFKGLHSLRDLSLFGNDIQTLPSGLFSDIPFPLTRLNLYRNPLNCNCSLHWLFNGVSDKIFGECQSPCNVVDIPLNQIGPYNITPCNFLTSESPQTTKSPFSSTSSNRWSRGEKHHYDLSLYYNGCLWFVIVVLVFIIGCVVGWARSMRQIRNLDERKSEPRDKNNIEMNN